MICGLGPTEHRAARGTHWIRRGLQAVIFFASSEDLARGVDFFTDGWTKKTLEAYARRNLSRGDAYVEGFPLGLRGSFVEARKRWLTRRLSVSARRTENLVATVFWHSSDYDGLPGAEG